MYLYNENSKWQNNNLHFLNALTDSGHNSKLLSGIILLLITPLWVLSLSSLSFYREVSFPRHTAGKWESQDSNSGIHTLIGYTFLHFGEWLQPLRNPHEQCHSQTSAPEIARGGHTPVLPFVCFHSHEASAIEVVSKCTYVKIGGGVSRQEIVSLF